MAKTLAIVFGIVFVVVGLLGYVGGLGIVGPTGIFQTDGLHDTVHFLSGLIFLAVAFWAPAKSSLTMVIFGIVYLLITVLGFAFGSPVLGLVVVNTADNYLHLLLGVVILIAGLSTRKEMAM